MGLNVLELISSFCEEVEVLELTCTVFHDVLQDEWVTRLNRSQLVTGTMWNDGTGQPERLFEKYQ